MPVEVDPLRDQQMPAGADQDEEAGAGDEGPLGERAQRLGLAVAVAVPAVGRLQRDPDAEEGDRGGADVGDAVDERAQDRDRAREQGSHQLEQDEDDRHREARDRGQAAQASVLARRRIGDRHRRHGPFGRGKGPSRIGEMSRGS